MASTHPDFEQLLLWQSGELDPVEGARIAEHLTACIWCQKDLTGIESLKERVVSVNTLAEQRNFRAALEQQSQSPWQRMFFAFLVPRFGMAAVASVLIVTLVVLSLTQFTPSAQAETLLNHAIKEQESDFGTSRFLRLVSPRVQCKFGMEAQGLPVRSAVLRDRENCQALTRAFYAEGWTKGELLSARSFQRWRKGLHHKQDSVRKLMDAVEITTSTNEGVIRTATLRVRSSDYRPVYGRYAFAADIHQDPVEVSEAVPGEPEAPIFTASAEHTPLPRSTPAQPHFADPLDVAEAEVRLALHHAGADQSVLIAVERQQAAIKVWGIAPSEQTQEQITSALKGQNAVILDIRTEDSSQKGALPWQAYRGDAPALALDELQRLYASDIEGRQKLLNSVDQVSRRLLAEARSRDALLRLAQRIQPTNAAQADELRSAAVRLERSMLADLSLLRIRLQPVLGSGDGEVHGLNEGRAIRLYLRLHELLFQARTDDSLDLDTASSEIRDLLG